MIGWDPWIKKRGYYFSCIEGKEGLEDCSAQNDALFVNLFTLHFHPAEELQNLEI